MLPVFQSCCDIYTVYNFVLSKPVVDLLHVASSNDLMVLYGYLTFSTLLCWPLCIRLHRHLDCAFAFVLLSLSSAAGAISLEL